VRRLGHITRHFNVGAYRRKIKVTDHGDVQDASFFDHNNEVRGSRLQGIWPSVPVPLRFQAPLRNQRRPHVVIQ
jgi:6-phosphofructo-2-kinase